MDGAGGGIAARVHADIEVSIGRTNSKRAIGFIVHPKSGYGLNPASEKNETNFVLDRDQYAELILYLRFQLKRLRKPIGKKQEGWCASLVTCPNLRLNRELEAAAMEAHPGWKRDVDFYDNYDDGTYNDWIAEPGAPQRH